MFAEADRNKNGRIDFEEFVEMMLPSATKQVQETHNSGPTARQL